MIAVADYKQVNNKPCFLPADFNYFVLIDAIPDQKKPYSDLGKLAETVNYLDEIRAELRRPHLSITCIILDL